MNLERVLPFVKKLLQNVIEDGDIVIDATVGNGHDTLFLADLVGPNGMVYGFDVQKKAIEATNRLLADYGYTRQITLFHESHAHVKRNIPVEEHGTIKSAIFNLGYLPGSDKKVITRPDSTLQAIQGLLEIIAVGGLIIVVVYHGHEGGKEEKDALLSYLSNLDQKVAHVLRYQFINQKNDPPFLIAIEKH
ncbi:class I SAM-dependent methyltransferase [Pseudalkalibacillus decolorationis]|uniref:class I SAM-dependent methyltransferase n=1 Tax=Pseudalkalibacillus decolorationis TaxID=163879 RepID=UPI0021476A9B|nr:class I SAM-dependent methyltransferase [Pseudalkalibacillus decolorationis]